jgi:hypothetical protein
MEGEQDLRIAIMSALKVKIIKLINLVNRPEDLDWAKTSSEGRESIDVEGDNKKVAFDRGVHSIGPENRPKKSAMARNSRTQTVGSEFLKSKVNFDRSKAPSEVPSEVQRIVPGDISSIREENEKHFSSQQDETLKSNLNDTQDIKKP